MDELRKILITENYGEKQLFITDANDDQIFEFDMSLEEITNKYTQRICENDGKFLYIIYDLTKRMIVKNYIEEGKYDY